MLTMNRMQKEEEKERRRVRDRQRRESMTQEQREQHLAKHRRNYMIRRQKTTNASLVPVSQSTISETSTNAHLQCLTPSNSLDHTLLYHPHKTSQIVEGSSIQLEGPPRRLRLNNVKCLARNIAIRMNVSPNNHRIIAKLISGDGSRSKPLRLNHVKHLARSLSFSSKNTTQKNHNDTVGENKMEDGKRIQIAKVFSKPDTNEVQN